MTKDPERDLFDYDKARAERDESMGRAEDHADDDWKAAALIAVHTTAQQLPLFTSEHVRRRIPPDVSTHEPRAIGPIIREAAKQGWMVKAKGVDPIPSARRHMAPLTVWRSQVFEGDEPAEIEPLRPPSPQTEMSLA